MNDIRESVERYLQAKRARRSLLAELADVSLHLRAAHYLRSLRAHSRVPIVLALAAVLRGRARGWMPEPQLSFWCGACRSVHLH
jgi:hypothetical protein